MAPELWLLKILLIKIQGEIMKKFVIQLGFLFISSLCYAGSTIQPVIVPPSVNISSVSCNACGAQISIASSTNVGPFSSGSYTYLTNVHLEMYASQTQMGPGGAKPVLCTSTGLPNTPEWFFPVVVTSGTVTTMDTQYANPLQGTQATAVVITCPGTNGATWNMNVGYYQGQ